MRQKTSDLWLTTGDQFNGPALHPVSCGRLLTRDRNTEPMGSLGHDHARKDSAQGPVQHRCHNSGRPSLVVGAEHRNQFPALLTQLIEAIRKVLSGIVLNVLTTALLPILLIQLCQLTY